jgi:hypothetical protein
MPRCTGVARSSTGRPGLPIYFTTREPESRSTTCTLIEFLFKDLIKIIKALNSLIELARLIRASLRFKMSQIDLTVFFTVGVWVYALYFTFFYFFLVVFFSVVNLWSKVFLALTVRAYSNFFLAVRCSAIHKKEYLSALK